MISRSTRLLYFFLSVITMSVNAQKVNPFNIEAGFGEFTLGADKSSFGNRIRFADSLTFNGVKDYFYVHSFDTAYKIAGIKFLDVLLTFDESNKLKQIELARVYTKNLFAEHKRRAIKDQEALIKYLTDQAGIKGKHKKRFGTLDASGYEWAKANVLTWAYLQTTEATKQKEDEFYSIHLVWGYKQNVE